MVVRLQTFLGLELTSASQTCAFMWGCWCASGKASAFQEADWGSFNTTIIYLFEGSLTTCWPSANAGFFYPANSLQNASRAGASHSQLPCLWRLPGLPRASQLGALHTLTPPAARSRGASARWPPAWRPGAPGSEPNGIGMVNLEPYQPSSTPLIVK